MSMWPLYLSPASSIIFNLKYKCSDDFTSRAFTLASLSYNFLTSVRHQFSSPHISASIQHMLSGHCDTAKNMAQSSKLKPHVKCTYPSLGLPSSPQTTSKKMHLMQQYFLFLRRCSELLVAHLPPHSINSFPTNDNSKCLPGGILFPSEKGGERQSKSDLEWFKCQIQNKAVLLWREEMAKAALGLWLHFISAT